MGGLGGAQTTAFIQLPWKPLSKPVSDPEERKGGGGRLFVWRFWVRIFTVVYLIYLLCLCFLNLIVRVRVTSCDVKTRTL